MQKKYLILILTFLSGIIFTHVYADDLPIVNTVTKSVQTQNVISENAAAKSALIKNKNISQQKKSAQDINKYLTKMIEVKNSALQKRISAENKVKSNPYAINFYEQTYVLPYYYTFNPYKEIYSTITPDNQPVKSNEFKAQFSIQVPLWSRINNKAIELRFGYTQLMFWQFYARNQYFRETDYQPELFVNWHALSNWMVRFGAVHESNGRGGEYERSWNRLYTDVRFSGNHWLFSIKPWVLIFRPQSSNLHNSDIADYLGHGRLLFAYKAHSLVLSFWERNAFESLFRRASYQADISFRIHGYLYGYIQYFTGYGQSLIEYNHKTKAVGIGIIISNWL